MTSKLLITPEIDESVQTYQYSIVISFGSAIFLFSLSEITSKTEGRNEINDRSIYLHW